MSTKEIDVQRWTGIVAPHGKGGFVAVGDYMTAMDELAALVDGSADLAAACAQGAGRLLGHLSTADAAAVVQRLNHFGPISHGATNR